MATWTWVYVTGQEYVRIEAVKGDEVLHTVTELPLAWDMAEEVAEQICQMHNSEKDTNPQHLYEGDAHGMYPLV